MKDARTVRPYRSSGFSAWESVKSVKSRWLLSLHGSRVSARIFFLTQRRKGRKGFYIVNWFYGLNWFSSWSSRSVETRKRSVWQLFQLLNHVVRLSPAYHKNLRVFFCTQNARNAQKILLSTWLHGLHWFIFSAWESVESVKSRWLFISGESRGSTRIGWVKKSSWSSWYVETSNTPHGNLLNHVDCLSPRDTRISAYGG